MKKTHLQAAPVVAMLALLLSAVPVAAETVPDGVVADAAVTVNVTAADSPVGGVPVSLDVLGSGGVLATRSGVTADDGSVTFSDAWRPDVGGPVLEWRATVAWSTAKYGAEAGLPANCVLSESLEGTTTVPASSGPAAIAVAATKGASSVACGPTLSGTVRDSTGQAFAVADAYVSATDSTGHVWQLPFTVSKNGSFTVAVPSVEQVSFFVRGAGSREAFENGCVYTYQQVVSQSVAVDPEADLALVAQEEAVLGACTATPRPAQGGGDAPAPPEPTDSTGGGALPNATPPFTGGGPALTPPATDTAAPASAAAASLELVLGLVGLASLLTFALVPRGRARGVRQTQ